MLFRSGCKLIVHNASGVVIYLGDSAVTTSTGLPLDKAAGPVTIVMPAQSKLYAIAASGTPSLGILKVGNN